MTRANECRAYFTLVGDFEPDEVSKQLSLEPSDAWKKGDRNEKTHYERKFSRWSLDSRLGLEASLEDHVEDVMAQMRVAADNVSSLCAELGGLIQLVGYFYESYPGLSFKPGTIIELASFNVGLDFDFLLSVLRQTRGFLSAN